MKTKILISALLTAMLLLSGCSSKPDDALVDKAVREELSKSVPERWMKAMVVGGNTKISSVKIVEWGDFNSERNYWPVKVKVAGSAKLRVPFGKAEVRNFDEIGEFRFYKDDYDKWQWKFIKPSLFGG